MRMTPPPPPTTTTTTTTTPMPPPISVNEIPPAPAEEEEVAVVAFSIWKQIDLSESYMVCCMFEEAASLAASVIQQVRNTTSSKADYAETSQVLESAGMVFVQSLKETGRTGELFVELEKLFGSVVEVPVQVFLTGACMQISEGHSSNLRAIFEEFLEKWPITEPQNSDGCQMHFGIDVEKHLEVAEVYAITLLGVVLHEPDAAISWTEQAAIPEGKRQEMLRKLRSLHISAQSSTSLGSATVQTSDKVGNSVSSGSGSAMGQKLLKTIPQTSPSGEEQKVATSKSIHSSIKHISDWSVRLKSGKFPLVLPRRKTMILVSLLLFAFYILRSRSRILKQFITRQVSSIRKALIDAWQLAFSVQVNPLAAVQQVPSPASRGSR